MMHRPWDCAQPDEWLPQSLRLCWGGGGDGGGGWGGDGGGGGWSGDSGGSGWGDGGYGGATTGGGDWGSAGSADFSGSWAGGDTNAWSGTAYDASTAGTGAGGGGDWGSFSSASFPDSTPGAIFTDIAGPNPGVTTGGGDWGSAGTSSFAGTGGGLGGTFGADSGLGGGGGFYGGGGGGGLFGDYGGGGGFTGGSNYGGGGLYGGGQQGGGTFGGFGSAGTSSGGRSGGPLGASSTAAGPLGGRGSTFNDAVGGGTLTGQTSGRTSDAPTRGEAEAASAPDADTGRADADADADPGAEPAQSDFGTPAVSEAAPEAEAGPSLSDAAPAGMIGGTQDAAPASAGQTAAPAQTSAFGPQSVSADYQGSPYSSDYDQSAPSQAYQEAAQTLSDLTQSALSGYDYEGSPYANMGSVPTAPDFSQAFQAFEAQPGWNPAEQTAGRAGLAEPTDWAANPLAEPGALGRDFNQAFDPFADTPTGMDLAGDLRSENAPLTFNEMWGDTPYNTLPNDPLSRSAQETLEHDFGYFPNPGYVQGPPAQTWGDRFNAIMNSIIDPAANVTMYPFSRALDALMAVPNPLPPGTLDPATAFSNFAQNALLGGSNIQSLNPDAIAAFEAGQQGRAGPNPDITPWGSVFEGAPTEDTAPAIESFIPGGRETNFEYGAPPTTAPINVDIVRSDDPSVPADPRGDPATPPADTLPPAVPTDESGRPAEAPPEAPPQAPPQQPQEAPPQAPPQQPQTPPQQTPQTPPSLIEQLPQSPPQAPPAQPPALTPPGVPTPQARPSDAPQQPPPPPQDPNDDTDDAADPNANTPVEPGRPLGAPTTRTQNTPVNTPRVRQEQQGATRNRPVSEALHGILTRAAEQADVIVRIGSGGQPSTGRDRTGSHRHDDGRAADIRLEQNGRLLNFNNSQDRVVMEAFVREAARLGATGQGAGMRYMGPNTIHVGFGNPNFWRADNEGSRALRQAWNEGRQGPANRPPADIPVRTAQPTIPLPGRRPTDAPQVEIAQPRLPEVEQPAALPRPDMPLPPAETPAPVAPVDRPPADVPAPALFLAPPARGRADPKWQADRANAILKEATKNLNKDSGQAAFQAASVVAAKGLAEAGIPLDMARSLMTKGALDGAIRNGYGPGGPNSTVLGISIWGKVQSAIHEGIAAALQGYNPGATGQTPQGGRYGPGPVQGPSGFQPDAPAAPGRQGNLGGLFHLAAGGRDVGAPPVIGPELGPGRSEWESSRPGPRTGQDPGVLIEGPEFSPPAPPPAFRGPDPQGRGRVIDPDIFPLQKQEQDLQQQQLDPRGWQQAGLNLLNMFNPISTAEAGGRGRSYSVPPGSTRNNPHFTFYGPGPGGKMEGAFETSRPNQAGTNVPITLDMVRSAREQGRDLLVTLASDPSRYGETLPVGTVTYVSPIDGKQYTLDNVRGFVHDTGSAFKGRPEKVDVAVSDYTGWSERAAGDHTALAHIGASPNAIAVVGPGEIDAPDMPAIAISPAPDMPMRGLAKGGHVDKDEPVVVGEEGPEYFMPDRPGTVFPHMPQSGKPGNVDRWPKVPAPEYPGRYGGLEREIRRQTREAQNPVPSLMDMVDSGQLRLTPNWHAMMNDPSLIALGRSRMDDRREGIDPGAEQYGAFIPAPGPAAEPPDPTNPMAQALGYGSIRRRPMQIGRQSY